MCGHDVDADGIHDYAGSAEHDRVLDIEAARSAAHGSIERARRELLAAVQAVKLLGSKSVYDVEVAEGGMRTRLVAALDGVDVTLAGVAALIPEPGLATKGR
ncbi:hypothetical protein ACQFYA_20870 [Promicromonospora sp. Marseille-Q5078]